MRDITNQNHEIEHYKQLALIDTVTGLPNLHQFERYLGDKAHDDKSSKPFATFMRVAICNIKEYENAFGEPTIDYILRILASRFIRIFEISAIQPVYSNVREALFIFIFINILVKKHSL